MRDERSKGEGCPVAHGAAEPVVRTGGIRWFYVCCGMVCVGLGVIGMFVPVWPSTVFFLGASCFFARSSPRLQRKLLEHPRVGPLVEMAHGRRMPLRAKVTTLVLMWSMIAVSSWSVSLLWVTVLAVGLGVAGSAVILFWIRTLPGGVVRG